MLSSKSGFSGPIFHQNRGLLPNNDADCGLGIVSISQITFAAFFPSLAGIRRRKTGQPFHRGSNLMQHVFVMGCVCTVAVCDTTE